MQQSNVPYGSSSSDFNPSGLFKRVGTLDLTCSCPRLLLPTRSHEVMYVLCPTKMSSVLLIRKMFHIG